MWKKLYTKEKYCISLVILNSRIKSLITAEKNEKSGLLLETGGEDEVAGSKGNFHDNVLYLSRCLSCTSSVRMAKISG